MAFYYATTAHEQHQPHYQQHQQQHYEPPQQLRQPIAAPPHSVWHAPAHAPLPQRYNHSNSSNYYSTTTPTASMHGPGVSPFAEATTAHTDASAQRFACTSLVTRLLAFVVACTC